MIIFRVQQSEFYLFCKYYAHQIPDLARTPKHVWWKHELSLLHAH